MLSALEKCFNRALSLSFSKKKSFFVFPCLILCGILLVFCRALALEASGWVAMSLVFLPLLLSSGILLSMGVLLIRIYHHEVKDLKINFRRLFSSSWELIIGTSYLSIPPILVYLLLWIVLGIFLLLKEIPGIGEFIGVILAFAPFLLILCSLILCLFNLLLLFFAAPAIALKTIGKLKLAKSLLQQFKENAFKNFFMFLVALLPIAIVIGFLSLAWHLTSISYLEMDHSISRALSWFFIMIPFAAFVTPATIFFFNFAAESYNLFYLKESA